MAAEKSKKKKGIALVTGATSGIGEATALELAKQGYQVIATGRRDKLLSALKPKLEKLSGMECLTLDFDISKRKEVEAVCKENKTWFQKINVLVNNAGLAKGVEAMPAAQLDDWETMIDTNIKGLLYMTRLIVPEMIKKGGGDIVNLGSVAGRWVYPGGGVYCATKFAVRALSEGLRMDTLGQNIRVINIEPGRVETEFSLVRLGDKKKAAQVYQGMTPLSSQDVAETILWCLDRPKHVNIQEVVIVPTDQASITLFNKRES